MMKTLLLVLGILLIKEAGASDIPEQENWVRSFYITPHFLPDSLVVVVRDANYIYGFLSHRLPNGGWATDMSEMSSDISFVKDTASYMGLIPLSDGLLTRTDNVDGLRSQLAKFGVIRKEFDGPSRIKLNLIEAIFIRYAANYPNFIETTE